MTNDMTGRATPITRRTALACAAALPFAVGAALPASAESAQTEQLSKQKEPEMTTDRLDAYPTLPGIRQRGLHDIDGLSVRILDAGRNADRKRRPLGPAGTAGAFQRGSACIPWRTRREAISVPSADQA